MLVYTPGTLPRVPNFWLTEMRHWICLFRKPRMKSTPISHINPTHRKQWDSYPFLIILNHDYCYHHHHHHHRHHLHHHHHHHHATIRIVVFSKHSTCFECLSDLSDLLLHLKYLAPRTVTKTPGRPELIDALERLAFNALPAAVSDDHWTHQYFELNGETP